MVKIWKNEGKSDKIIAVVDNMLYKCTPKEEDADEFVRILKRKDIPEKNVFGIPFSYIKELRHQKGKDYIQIFFRGNSEEHLRIADPARLQEVFEYLKETLPNSKYFIDEYKPLRAGKKPLIALLVVSILFIWTLYIAIGLQSGEEYDVAGHHYNSFAGIVLMFASLGVKNVILIYTPLMAIAILSFTLKARNPPVLQRLIISRR
ncbi:MAG TPA: hypothetical protein VL727_16445 [Puia sp.]|nr:hypothetical protein [Puia sp.]